MLEHFKANVEEVPDMGFVGWRRKTVSPEGVVSLGEYEWSSYA